MFSLCILHKPSLQTMSAKDIQTQEELDHIWSELETLRKENEKLHQEVQRLKEKTKTNSKNSSKPPSQDPNRKKVTKPKSKRNQGAQPGHKGTSRKPIPSDQVDKVVSCFPQQECTSCCGKVEVEVGNYRTHQQWDLPKVKPIVTEFRLHQGACRECGSKAKGNLPAGIPSGVLGVHAMSKIASLTGDYRVSRREAQRMLQEEDQIEVSLGTISHVEQEVSKAIKPAWSEVKTTIQEEEVVHCDETSHKQKGEIGRAHV